MPDQLKFGIEQLSGYSLDDVRVHYNSPKPAEIDALAYAQGTEIYVASGQKHHLPHEVWHVIQQAQGRVRPKTQMKDGGPGNYNDKELEHEADVMAGKAWVAGAQLEGTIPLSPRADKAQGESQLYEVHLRRRSVVSPLHVPQHSIMRQPATPEGKLTEAKDKFAKLRANYEQRKGRILDALTRRGGFSNLWAISRIKAGPRPLRKSPLSMLSSAGWPNCTKAATPGRMLLEISWRGLTFWFLVEE